MMCHPADLSNIYLRPCFGCSRVGCGSGGGRGRGSAVIPPSTHGTRLSDSCWNTNGCESGLEGGDFQSSAVAFFALGWPFDPLLQNIHSFDSLPLLVKFLHKLHLSRFAGLLLAARNRISAHSFLPSTLSRLRLTWRLELSLVCEVGLYYISFESQNRPQRRM